MRDDSKSSQKVKLTPGSRQARLAIKVVQQAAVDGCNRRRLPYSKPSPNNMSKTGIARDFTFANHQRAGQCAGNERTGNRWSAALTLRATAGWCHADGLGFDGFSRKLRLRSVRRRRAAWLRASPERLSDRRVSISGGLLLACQPHVANKAAISLTAKP